MNWLSLAKANGDSKVVVVDATPQGGDPDKIMAGLVFVNAQVNNRELTLRCLDSKQRIRVKLTDEMRNMHVPGYWINEELEVVRG